jgi:hypothetical protein
VSSMALGIVEARGGRLDVPFRMLTGGRERRLTQTVTNNGVGAALIQVLTVPPRQLGGYAISTVRILHGKSRDQQLAVGRRCGRSMVTTQTWQPEVTGAVECD